MQRNCNADDADLADLRGFFLRNNYNAYEQMVLSAQICVICLIRVPIMLQVCLNSAHTQRRYPIHFKPLFRRRF